MTIPSLTRRHLLVGSSAVAVAGLVRPRFAWSAVGDTLRIRTDADFQVLDPAFMTGGIEDVILEATTVSLTRFTRDGSTNWDLDGAESIEQVDDVTIDFKLHEGIVWSGGLGEVTTEDVKYSFERIAFDDEAVWQDYWKALKEVEVIDKYRGRIHLQFPFAPLWMTLPRYTGRIVSKKAVEAAGGKFTTELPAQCGPYRLTEWQPTQRSVLELNPDWIGEKPEFPRIEMIVVADAKTAELAYEAGELEYTEISVSSVPSYRESLPKNTKMIEKAGLNYMWVGINVDHPPFNDVRVRQAVQYAVDTGMVIDGAYGGLATQANGFSPPGVIGHRTSSSISHDPDRARALLAEAGLAAGFSTTLTTQNITEWLSICQIIQANLAEVGISVEILSYDPGVFWNLGLESEGEDWKDLQLTLQQFTIGPDPHTGSTWFTNDQVGVWNWQRNRSDEFAELHEKAIEQTDPQKRHEEYVRMQQIMEESGAYVFLVHELNAAIYNDGIDPAVKPDFTPQLKLFRRA